MCLVRRAWQAVLGAVGAVVLWFVTVGGLAELNIVDGKAGGPALFIVGLVPAAVFGAVFGWKIVRKARPMTAAEFWEWASLPGNQDRRVELVRGKVVEVPIPGERHGIVCAWLGHLLWDEVQQRACGGACSAATALLVEENPDTVLVPDLLVFDELRPLAELSRRYSTAIPRLIVEVLSPSDDLTNVKWRIARYLGRGTPLVWVVDAEEQTVTVYRSGQENRALGPMAELTGEEVLPGLRLRVAELFTLPNQAPVEASP